MQLVEEAAEIVLDCLFTQLKGASYFFVAQAVSQALQDLFLTWTHPKDFLRRSGGAGAKQQLCSEAREYVTFAPVDPANACNELCRRYPFQGVAGDSSAQECHHCILIRHARQNQELQIWILARNGLNDLRPIARRSDVHNQHIGREIIDNLQGIGWASALRDDSDV